MIRATSHRIVRDNDKKSLDIERVVKEYATYKINYIRSNDLMQDWYKQESISKIERALSLYKQYMLSADETMRIISES